MADNNLSILNSTLPITATEIITSYDTGAATVSLLPSYVNVSITNGGLLNGTYDAWCINSTFALKQGTYNNAKVYSSYGNIVTGILSTGLQSIDLLGINLSLDPFLDKLQQINWLINNVTEAANTVSNKYQYNGVDYTWGDVQLAIWKLLGEDKLLDSKDYSSLEVYSQQNANTLVNLAVTNGSNFVPVAGQDFGVIVQATNLQPILMEVKTAGIGDFVWNDLNANGIQDAGEEGIDGATVTLLDANGKILGTTITGDKPNTPQIEKGWYEFGPLLPSTYQVRFTLPTSFNTVSPYLQGSNTFLDSNANPSNNFTSTPITLVGGQVNRTIDAGFYKYASLGDYVFADNNANGIQDAGDTALAGVTVALVQNGKVVATTTSDNKGAYLFNNLIPGDYQVQFTAPAGYMFTSPDVGSDDTFDSDANPTTGYTQTVTLTSGQFNGTLDAGLVPLASLGDRVFHDLNANGIQDANESGIAGACVNLLKDGVVLATTTTDGSGKYSFNNITPGTGYQVQFVTPAGFTQTSPVNVGANNAIDSDGTLTGVVTLAPGENNPTLDSGFYNLASLGDYVFADNNANGIQDTGDTALAGVTVALMQNGKVVATATSNTNGAYLFNNLIPGDYQVKFTAPAGYMFTSPDAGSDDTFDSDANPNTGYTQTVTLTSGQFNGTLDAGLIPLASVGDKVFHDLNANGIQDANESGIAGACVNLLKDGVVLATTTTDGSGKYSFNNITPGTGYQVQFVTPAGFTQTSPVNVGANNAIDSDGTLTGVVTLAPGENNPTLDSGFYNLASLGDYVFADNNANGIQDAGDTALAGVTVALMQNGTVVATTTSDSNGAYLFNNLIPGDYQVKFTAPAGYMFTSPDAGSDDTFDSDANPTTGYTQTVTLTSGQFNGTLDAGLVPLASLGDRVFHDLNANGIQDANESGIASATVNLLNVGGNPIASTTTDANGLYSFTNLQPGDYKVQFVQPNGFNGVSPTNVGANNAIDSDAGANLTSGVITLSPGENNTTVDAGFYKTASLGDFVFNDINKNGLQDVGEVGVGGVTVTLVGGGTDGMINGISDTIVSTTTDASGNYNFTGLTPGQQYQVQFSNLPAGYQFTQADVGTNDALDSDVNPNTGKTQIVTLTSGENNTTLDAGISQITVKIGDRVWYDTNGNGIQDTSELGVAGVGVKLFNQAGTQIGTTTTDTNGLYQFTVNANNSYSLQFAQPTGFDGFSKADVGNDATDTDVINTNGTTAQFFVGTSDNLTIDAGLIKNIGDLSITKTDGLTTVIPSQQVTYNIVVSNNGQMTATNALVSDIIPSLLTNVTWTSVAYGGATDNQTSGTGNINDDVTLVGGSSIIYTVNGTVAANALSSAANNNSKTSTFNFSSNSWTSGTYGNIRTFSVDGMSVKASAFARNSSGTWSSAYLGSYTGGLGVSDQSKGTAYSDEHRVDNLGQNNYVLFEFSDSVVVDRAELRYVVGDSDASVWIGNFNNPFNNHITLSDSVLNSFGFTEVNFGGGSNRWADLNAGKIVGNTLVIAAKTGDANDQFKIASLDVQKYVAPTTVSLTNTATVTAPTGFTDTNPNNNSATDTDTIIPAPTVKIGDRVWYDTNGNGIQDTGELGVAGVGVKLFNQAGTQIGTTTTDTNGLYQFTVNGNNTYSLQFVQPTGFNGFSKADVGNDATDSDVINTNGTTAQFFVGTSDNLTIDAGLIKNIGDLWITKTDNLTTVAPGQQITYTIVVGNNSQMTATNALVSDIMPSLLTNVTWTSVAYGGATDNQISGTGNINDYVTLVGGSSITYTVNGTVAANTSSYSSGWNTFSYGSGWNTFSDDDDCNTSSDDDDCNTSSDDDDCNTSSSNVLTNTATVTGPTGFTDTNPNNNSATDTDSLINAPGVRTPGFWRDSNWQKFWDGIQGNEPSQKTQSNFADSDLLFAPYTNSAQPGKVLDPITGQYDVGLLIGDYNRNGKTDAGEQTIFYTRAQALQIVDSSAQPDTQDKRYDLGRSLVASWLNYLAGNPIDTANGNDKDARYYISEGINWLQALTPDENCDGKGDGALNKLTGSVVNSPLANTYWNQGISSASSLPSPYNTNTNVLYPIDAGYVINFNLDCYNKGYGLADNVFYGGNP